MKIELNLFSPNELRAFAVFLGEVAADRQAVPTTLGAQHVTSPLAVEGLVAQQNIDASQSEIPEQAPVEEKKARKPRAKKAEAPVVAETPAEIQAQDEADEAEEAEATAGDALTRDNVRDALGQYVGKYGLPAAQEDGPKLFKLVFPDLNVVKISDIPDTQEALKKALDGVNEMLAKNPFKRQEV